jgi:transforming growth factor-beta-induced protein
MKLLSRITFLALILFVSVSCSDDDDGAPQVQDFPNLVEAAQSAGLTTLLDAVGAVDGLDQTLLNAESITVFAPDNDAFANALTAFGVSDLNGLVDAIGGVDQLETVLGFHVVPATAFSIDLAEGEQTFTTLSGQDIVVTRNGTDVSVTDAAGNVRNVTLADVQIENGVVHVIDGVLLPELPPVNTFSIIANSPDHTVLEQALIDTGLDAVLASGTFTVFAPTDTAFGNIDISGLTTAELTNVLYNHVVTGNVLSTDLSTGYINTNAVETYSGDDNFINMFVNTDGGVTLNGSSTVGPANIESLNGTVHVVDAVITIPNVVDLAAANPMFSNLAAALTQESLLGALSTDADTAPAPFTVFAPNNMAFQNFIDEDPNDGFNSIDDILALSSLSAVLTYHVVDEAAVREGDITDGLSPETLQGETFTINTTNGVTITDVNGRVTNIIATNVTGSNGVIHVLDNVILPSL